MSENRDKNLSELIASGYHVAKDLQTYTDDLNELKYDARAVIHHGTTNSPFKPGDGSWGLLEVKVVHNSVIQEITDYFNSNKKWCRVYFNGKWGQWNIYTGRLAE